MTGRIKPFREIWKASVVICIIGGLLFSALINVIFAMDGSWDWALFGILSVITTICMFLYFAAEDYLKKAFGKYEKSLTLLVGIIIVILFILGVRFIPSTI